MKAFVPCLCALALSALTACNRSGPMPEAAAPAADAPAQAAPTAPVPAAMPACGSPGSDAEKLVCADPALSALAGRLDAAYAKASESVAASDKPALRDEQARWERQTRDLCRDAACLTQVYTDRSAVLARNEPNLIDQVSCETPTGASACVDVVAVRDPNGQVDAFNKAIGTAGEAGKILGCRTLIDIAAGTADGNHSFGGVCTREDRGARSDVRICYDRMVGNFAIEPVKPGKEVVKELIDFTNDRCAQG